MKLLIERSSFSSSIFSILQAKLLKVGYCALRRHHGLSYHFSTTSYCRARLNHTHWIFQTVNHNYKSKAQHKQATSNMVMPRNQTKANDAIQEALEKKRVGEGCKGSKAHSSSDCWGKLCSEELKFFLNDLVSSRPWILSSKILWYVFSIPTVCHYGRIIFNNYEKLFYNFRACQ